MHSTVNIINILRTATTALATLPDSSPQLEAELLLTEATGWARTTLRAWPERELDSVAVTQFEQLLARRLRGEPIAYIRGRQAFWTLDLQVSPATLIPRPETEQLVEIALELLAPAAALQIADLGTGSGAIAAALASERCHWTLFAVDRAPTALAVATANFRALKLHNVTALRGDWLRGFASASLDGVISNPPYITAGDPHLIRGDLRFEPPTALAAGIDGLTAIRAILGEVNRCVRHGGLIAIEHGFEQGAAVRQLFAAHELQRIETQRDLNGLERITLGYRPRANSRSNS
ncbi:peptide chain release factor N(5)-glutamine methyltransferase [Chromatium okenii]|uniref:Release factor glutamine methyltransferase n=1 Tax=Chromatium okenii TaxID=61644 RepID=A0A2S7XU56_9GAMM|nr:peptide chain release factor N(5)-glutamine methyltransferase [Chromatium okenii]